ncbi:MAG: hypothetical protein K5666_02125 [Bacilli bacterium]|nr:hypothetical protein [Bacilli bacterium]
MDDILYLSSLYDYYKELLTDKQRSYFEDYYFDNLTMEEIAENNDISKNAVSKTIIEVKEKLLEYENALHLLENKNNVKKILTEEEYEKIKNYI